MLLLNELLLLYFTYRHSHPDTFIQGTTVTILTAAIVPFPQTDAITAQGRVKESSAEQRLPHFRGPTRVPKIFVEAEVAYS